MFFWLNNPNPFMAWLIIPLIILVITWFFVVIFEGMLNMYKPPIDVPIATW